MTDKHSKKCSEACDKYWNVQRRLTKLEEKLLDNEEYKKLQQLTEKRFNEWHTVCSDETFKGNCRKEKLL